MSRVGFAILALGICLSGTAFLADEVTLDWAAERPNGSYQARVDSDGFVYSTTGQFLLKFDLDGNELWLRELDSLGGLRSVGRRLAIDPDGNVFVIGTNTAIPNAMLTMKYDPQGNQLWEAIMPSTGTPVRVETDAAGNAYVLGWTMSALPDFVTAKYDPEGNLLWRNEFAGGVINEASGLTVSAGGDVAVTGRSNIVGNAYDASVVVYDTDGNERWWRNHSSTSTGGGSDRGSSVAFGPAGEVYVGGSSENHDADWDTTLIKYDAEGNELWVRDHNFDPGPNNYDSILWIGVDSFGNVLAAGQSDGNVIALKYDADGNLLWVRQHDGGYGGSNYVLHMVVGPYDDAMYIAGLNGVSMTLAIKYDTNGNLRWTFLHTYGGFTNYYAWSIDLDPGNNVVLGKTGKVVFHLLQSDCTLGAPADVNGVWMEPDRVHWTPGTNGEQYDVARGDLELLTSGRELECIVTETAQTSCVDQQMPIPGQVLVYMVRPANVCGVGGWGTGMHGEARAAICP
jgi:YD repeat-containing protein